ncbi:hypothetical protein SHKM778_39250 [Streptomyces sp. KM77-8]|uniref:DUF1918 domain-containing protein n=1 Tax=Streptomyces haneummycinicus TaxID=3074435 RepID=A0AAT9HJT5_9ACTN
MTDQPTADTFSATAGADELPCGARYPGKTVPVQAGEEVKGHGIPGVVTSHIRMDFPGEVIVRRTETLRCGLT